MAKAGVSVEELVGMIERGELRLPEMQRRYVWRSTRVRDLLDSLYPATPRAPSCCGRPTRPFRCRSSPSSSRRTRTTARASCSTGSSA